MNYEIAYPRVFAVILFLSMCADTVGQNKSKKTGDDGVFRDPMMLLDRLPRELIRGMREGSQTLDESNLQANNLLVPMIKDLPFELEVTVAVVDKLFVNGTTALRGYSVITKTEKLKTGSSAFYCNYNIVFDEVHASKVTRLSNGQKIKVKGTVTAASFSTMSLGKSVWFTFGLKGSDLK